MGEILGEKVQVKLFKRNYKEKTGDNSFKTHSTGTRGKKKGNS